MREQDVVDAFALWLGSEDWDVRTEVDFADVDATRGDERLVAEAKGTTAAPGLDVDTMFGQVLRRLSATGTGVRWAVVVPDHLVSKVLRVPTAVLSTLAIEVYPVSDEGVVDRHA
jgi:hypothetical protein